MTKQEPLSQQLLEESESETRWKTLFDSSPEMLSQLADEALAEHQRGETLSLDTEKLNRA